ncbi:hypothetical protein V8E36_004282 [Tilletia maclaganii]
MRSRELLPLLMEMVVLRSACAVLGGVDRSSAEGWRKSGGEGDEDVWAKLKVRNKASGTWPWKRTSQIVSARTPGASAMPAQLGREPSDAANVRWQSAHHWHNWSRLSCPRTMWRL